MLKKTRLFVAMLGVAITALAFHSTSLQATESMDLFYEPGSWISDGELLRFSKSLKKFPLTMPQPEEDDIDYYRSACVEKFVETYPDLLMAPNPYTGMSPNEVLTIQTGSYKRQHVDIDFGEGYNWRKPRIIDSDPSGRGVVAVECLIYAYEKEHFVGNILYIILAALDGKCVEVPNGEGRFILDLTYSGDGHLRLRTPEDIYNWRGRRRTLDERFIRVSQIEGDQIKNGWILIPPHAAIAMAEKKDGKTKYQDYIVRFDPATRTARLAFHYANPSDDEQTLMFGDVRGDLVIPFGEDGEADVNKMYLDIFDDELPLRLVSRETLDLNMRRRIRTELGREPTREEYKDQRHRFSGYMFQFCKYVDEDLENGK